MNQGSERNRTVAVNALQIRLCISDVWSAAFSLIKMSSGCIFQLPLVRSEMYKIYL